MVSHLLFNELIGQSADPYTVGTLLLLCSSSLFRVTVLQIEDIIDLIYIICRSNGQENEYTQWHEKNFIKKENLIDELHLFGLHFRNFSFMINIARWYIIVK